MKGNRSFHPSPNRSWELHWTNENPWTHINRKAIFIFLQFACGWQHHKRSFSKAHVTVAEQACLKSKLENTLRIQNAHFKMQRHKRASLCPGAVHSSPEKATLCTYTHTRIRYGVLALWLCEHTWPQGNRLRPAPYFRQTKQPIDSNGFKLLMTWAKNEEPLNLLKETVNVRRPTADLWPDLNHSHLW